MALNMFRIALILYATFHNCQSQITTTDGPTNTVYVSQNAYASFNCSVNWKANDNDLDSIYWDISEDNTVTWSRIAQCYFSGACVMSSGRDVKYSVDTNSPNHDFFKLNIGPASLAEDGLYECYSFDEQGASAPHARLVVLEQSGVPDIEGYSSNEQVTVRETSPFEFTCTSIGGNPAADLIWEIIDQNDRTDITDITSSSTSTTTENSGNNKLYDTTSILNHTFNSSDDGKNLKCSSFQHDFFTPISDQIVLNVEHSPVIHTIAIFEWYDNYLVDVECVATANPDGITYSWVSYGGDSGQTGSGRTWQVEDINQDGEIDVSCTADNGIGSPNTLKLELNKPYSPVIHTIAIVEWYDNYLVDVECVATANPDSITYSWVSYGGDSGQTGSGRTWQVEDIDQDGEIVVSCTAENGIGSPNTLKLKLYKPYKPVISTTSITEPTSTTPCTVPSENCECENTAVIVIGCLLAVILMCCVLLLSVLWARGALTKSLRKDTNTTNDVDTSYESLRPRQSSPYMELNVKTLTNVEDQGYANLSIEPEYENPESITCKRPKEQSTNTMMEFPKDRLWLKEVLVGGNFNMVVNAQAWFIGGKDGVSDVVVKMLKASSTPQDVTDFQKEIECMTSLPKHENIMSLLGFCTKEAPPYLIMEFLHNGSLYDYLRSKANEPRTIDQHNELISLAIYVVNGMRYMEQQKVVHRELRALNILVDNKGVCKLSGFGSSSLVVSDHRYRVKRKGSLPIRWFSVEVLSGTAFTTKSDVWSFGVLLWEIMSLGDIPYGNVTDNKIQDMIKEGKHLPNPEGNPESIYHVMTSCWVEDGSKRPTFISLADTLNALQLDDNTSDYCNC
ncbi:uncharacterized protein LOC144440020 [Glandiceps talaboti]